MNFNIESRAIWLTSHPPSFYRENDLVLTDEGRRYANALSKLIESRHPAADLEVSPFEVWTSFLKRSLEMAEYLSPVSSRNVSLLFNSICKELHLQTHSHSK
jgi:broad specificity phosphatase PhoE